MEKDEIKGKAKDVTGRVQRHVGEWTGDEEAQAEGMAKQAEGKAQSAWGKVKKAGKALVEDIKHKAKKGREAA